MAAVDLRAGRAPAPQETAAAGRLLHFTVSGTTLISETRREGEATVIALSEGRTLLGEAVLTAVGGDAALAFRRLDIAHPDAVHRVAALVEAAFGEASEASRLLVADPARHAALAPLATSATGEGEARRGIVERHVFRQLPLLWRVNGAHACYPAFRSALGPADRLTVLRPPRPAGTFYRRYLPHLDTTLSFRAIDRRRDLKLFHGWMNDGRVAFFWELAKSETELDTYLAEQEADPHIFGVIGAFDDEPVGYFEFYWAKEDRLGPYYEPDDFDRGWHGLVGNVKHLGRPKTLAWFRSITHYLFLDEPRTQRIVGEPRASHQKMLSYCEDAAYDKVKVFDFPHKRAMLVMCRRERFFREVPL